MLSKGGCSSPRKRCHITNCAAIIGKEGIANGDNVSCWTSQREEYRAGSGNNNDRRNGDDDANSNCIDYVGGLLISIDLVLLQVGLSQRNVHGWANWYVPALVLCSAILGPAFVHRQLDMECEATRRPLVRLSMLRNAGFLPAFAVVACFYTSYNRFLIFTCL
ncbi:hypothetical protein F4814DRAFT_450017 [Daldinia grandis]|nr:hypothetical protein F4814DRAFT_450017 [Daldinia grandis]